MNTDDPESAGVDDIAGARAGVFRRAGDALRSLLGLHRRIVVDGVRYTERSAEPLRRALSRRGSGRKDYDAVFPGGTSMRIRATPGREYADLVGSRLRPVYTLVERLTRPGMRELDAGAGTGNGAASMVERVGPSGAVVALDRDRESVRYAQARYRAPNVAFECGWLDALAGETDGAFDGVVCADAIHSGDDPEKSLRELWRLVAPGGWLLLATPTPTPDADARAQGRARAFTGPQLVELVRAAVGAASVGEGETAAGVPGKTGEDEASVETAAQPTPTDAGGRLVVLIQRPER